MVTLSTLGDGAKAAAKKPVEFIDNLGDQLSFYLRALGWTGRTITRYRREVLRIMAETFWGTGALAIIGGTVGVMLGLTLFVGIVVGMQGYAGLDQIGAAALSGFASAYINTREVAPLVAGLALSATVGAGFTAQLGAMRISEEIDAVEVMAVPSLPFLVTTRIVAGFVAIIPLYIIGLLASYIGSRFIVVMFYAQSVGTYDHYFELFLPKGDVFVSFGKVLIFAVMIILNHCYFGYTASGGPAGVGVAVGRAVKTTIVVAAVLNFVIDFGIWGTDTQVRIAG